MISAYESWKVPEISKNRVEIANMEDEYLSPIGKNNRALHKIYLRSKAQTVD